MLFLVTAMNTDDQQTHIMDTYRHNPRRGFDLLYAAVADRLVTYALRSFGLNRSEAEDAVHDALLPWVEQPDRLKSVDKPFSYLFTSVRHACLKRLKQNSRHTDDDPAELAETAPVAAAAPDTEAVLDIAASLVRIPAEQREVIVLRIWGDLSLQEVADIQETTVPTVASRYRYGLAKLKEVLS